MGLSRVTRLDTTYTPFRCRVFLPCHGLSPPTCSPFVFSAPTDLAPSTTTRHTTSLTDSLGKSR